MSRCVSLYQARAKASANACGLSRNLREIFSNAGSKRSVRSVVSIVGLCFLPGMCASGMISGAFLATHCLAPAGGIDRCHSDFDKWSHKTFVPLDPEVIPVTFRALGVADPSRPTPQVVA